MLIWVLKDGENLPIQPGARRMRTGMLAAELTNRGHRVVWWSSTMSHQRKTLLYSKDISVRVADLLTLRLIHAGSYARNISLRRYIHHRRLAWRFRKLARQMPVPDVIVSAFPIIDLAYEAVRYARERGVPIIVDIRDLWPDTLVEQLPQFARPAARRLLAREYAFTRRLLAEADSLVAISQGCLNWGLALAGRRQSDQDRVFYTGYPGLSRDRQEVSNTILGLRRIAAGKVVFTYVGSFGHSYDLDLVCDVARLAADRGLRDVHFVLVGDGERFAHIRRRAGTLSNLTLTGWVDKTDLADVLALASVGIAPCDSVVDAAPNKLFEYLSAGLPVLSSLQGDAEDIIAKSDVGFSYPSGSKEVLFSRVDQLARDPELRRRQAANARRLFDLRFRSETIYGSYAEHVEAVICRSQSARPE